MKRQSSIALLLLLAVSILTSCRKEAEVISLDKLKTCPAEYNGKDIAVEAYLTMPRGGKMLCLLDCLVELNSEPATVTDRHTKLIVWVRLGKGPNQIEEAPEFMQDQAIGPREFVPDEEHTRRFYENLRVRTDDGKIVRLKDKVRLAGNLEASPQDDCYFRVGRIEQP
jgi:hypothetical protein